MTKKEILNELFEEDIDVLEELYFLFRDRYFTVTDVIEYDLEENCFNRLVREEAIFAEGYDDNGNRTYIINEIMF